MFKPLRIWILRPLLLSFIIKKRTENASFNYYAGAKKNGEVGGFSKILRNFQSGSWQMLTSAYKVGGWGEKRPKTCLRNI